MSDTATTLSQGMSGRLIWGYLLMIAVAAMGIWAICEWGTHAYPRSAEVSTATAAATPDGISTALHLSNLARLLIALVTVLAVGLLFGQLFRFFGQPAVIGEVFAGIALGPSFLGAEWSAVILPPEIAPYLGMIAQLGVVLFMFLVGVELNTDLLRTRAHSALAISHAKGVTRKKVKRKKEKKEKREKKEDRKSVV